MKTNQQNSILNFIASCNEFLAGKFLFAASKLTSIFEEIEQNPVLKDLFVQCNQDFDYSLQCTISLVKTPTKPGYFVRPEELDKFLALTYGILKDIYEQKIDYNIFVSKYFSSDDKNPPTKRFGEEVILPLKDTVAKYFELDAQNTVRHATDQIEQELDQPEQEQQAQEQVEQEQFDLTPVFESLVKIAQNMMTIAKEDKKIKQHIKADLIFVLSQLVKACKDGDIEKAYAFVISLKYITAKIRSLKHLMAELLFVMMQLENA